MKNSTLKIFTFVLFCVISISGVIFAQEDQSEENDQGTNSASNVRFVFQIPIGGELGLNKTPGGYLNLLGGLGVDYIPQHYSVHVSYIPFATRFSDIDINAGYIFNDNTELQDRGIMVGHEDLGDKVQMTFRATTMGVRSFNRIRAGYNRMFTTNKDKQGDHTINTFYVGFESSDLINNRLCALNSWYVDLMYGTYEGQRQYDKDDMNKFGGRIGFSSDWGWSVSTIEEIGYKPVAGITLLWACQIFFMM